MSDTYVTLKVREALKASAGNRAQAQRRLVAMALEDEQLLRGLAMPFLKAIAGSAVERVARAVPGAAAPAKAGAPVPGGARTAGGRPAKRLPPAALDALVARMGQEAPPAPLGRAEGGAEVTPDQANAMKTLAAAFRSRK